MNVYDFDGTIYRGDSSVDFYLFCLLRRPRIVFYLPYQASFFILCKLGIISKEKAKSAFFSFLRSISCVEEEVELFWQKHVSRIVDWYKQLQHTDDVVISASPDFLLRPLCNKLLIHHLIATKIETTTGLLINKNCHGSEKVRRFYEIFPNSTIENFYSDSAADTPLAKEALRAFKVIHAEQIKPWNK